MKIVNKAKILVAGMAVVLMGALAPMSVSAKIVCPANTPGAFKEADNFSECGVEEKDNNLIATMKMILTVVTGVVGFIAVAMIILGGIGYTTSAGDSGKVKKAKDTIMYGIIGLIVAMLAFAIVNFVLSSVFSSGV